MMNILRRTLRPRSGDRLRIAMVGTRGVPAQYGGFETAVEEIGQRLAAQGHHVTVYCRNTAGERPRYYRGMKLIHLPALRFKAAETLSHTALSALHLLTGRRHDVVFMFNAANAPFIPVCRLRRTPVAVHVDGLEWRRTKWGGKGRKYYRQAEELAVRWGDALIADAPGIADYYLCEFGADTTLLTYGAPVLERQPTDKLQEQGLDADNFHLVVARFEPENHVDMIVEGYNRSECALPLVVVGSAPYAEEHSARIRTLADADPRVRLLGGVWDQELLNQLYAHARTYVHGHSVGGTNPSLLRAMGAGTAVVAYDVIFNREVLGGFGGAYFQDAATVAGPLEALDADPQLAAGRGAALQQRARETYTWDEVADGYLQLAEHLVDGASTRNPSARRRPGSAWSAQPVRRNTSHQLPTARPVLAERHYKE